MRPRILDLRIISRFLSAGVFNTAAGFAVIFGLMAVGAGAYVANVAGYAVGLTLSFFTAKLWVFQSKGRAAPELARFIVTFACAYLANILTLWICLRLGLWPYLAQVAAAGVYTGSMLVISAAWVFNQTRRADQ